MTRLGDTHPLIPGIAADAARVARKTSHAFAEAARDADVKPLERTGGTVPTHRHYPGHTTDDPNAVFGPT